ncbi:MAG: CinA family protein [Nitrospirae bacterium]|nr:CinA family protein [Nitrospirota bacterium]
MSVSLEEVIGILLKQRGWKISTAESCTGGLVAHRITNVSGSSDYFDSGVITYSNESKIELLKVPEEIIKTHGAVSGQTAVAMAEGIRRLRGTDIGVGITGIAGPTGGSEVKPVGLVYIALSASGCVECKEFLFTGDRGEIKLKTSEAALDMIRRFLENDTIAA